MTNEQTSSRINAFLHSEPSPDVVNDMHSHLLEHATDADWQNAMEQLWQDSAEATMPAVELDAAYARVHQRISGKPNVVPLDTASRWKRMLRMVAMWVVPIALMALLALMAIDNISLRDKLHSPITYANYYAPMGSNRQFMLPDQTHVWLHGGSTLVVASNYNKNERRVYLSGEGFFKVAPDKEKQFVVSTNNLEMKVLGTEFNVSAYPEDEHIVTTLEQGSLQVLNTLNQNSITLKPGDLVAYSTRSGRFRHEVVKTADYSSWRYGYIFFNNIKVSDLLVKLEREYGVRFVMQNNSPYLSQRIRARFNKNESLDNILGIVHMLVPQFRYKMKGDTVYIN